MFENFSRVGYIIIIALIIGAAFLSQQTYAGEYGMVYFDKLSNWAVSSASGAYAKFNRGDKTGGGVVQTTANENKNAGKNNFLQNIFQK